MRKLVPSENCMMGEDMCIELNISTLSIPALYLYLSLSLYHFLYLFSLKFPSSDLSFSLSFCPPSFSISISLTLLHLPFVKTLSFSPYFYISLTFFFLASLYLSFRSVQTHQESDSNIDFSA